MERTEQSSSTEEYSERETSSPPAADMETTAESAIGYARERLRLVTAEARLASISIAYILVLAGLSILAGAAAWALMCLSIATLLTEYETMTRVQIYMSIAALNILFIFIAYLGIGRLSRSLSFERSFSLTERA